MENSKSKTLTKEWKDSEESNEIGKKERKSANCDLENHGEFTSERVLLFNGWSNWSTCYECYQKEIDDDKIRVNSHKARIKSEAHLQRTEKIFGKSGMPKRFKGYDMASYKPINELSGKYKEYCANYATNFPKYLEKGTSILFCGTTGTGKTHLACAIANHIINHHSKTVVFTTVSKAIRKVKETYSDKVDITEQKAIDAFIEPDLLILDEIGVQFGTNAEKIILFEIINERYLQLKPTILISNLSGEKLKDYTGDRVIDRMTENGGKLLIFNWKSHRGN